MEGEKEEKIQMVQEFGVSTPGQVVNTNLKREELKGTGTDITQQGKELITKSKVKT